MYMENMSTVIRKNFIAAGITTDEQIVRMSFKELMSIPRIGLRSIEEVNQKIRIPMGLEPLLKPLEAKRKARDDKERKWCARRKKAVRAIHSKNLKSNLYLKLKRRTWSSLYMGGVFTEKQLIKMSYDELIEIRGIGHVAIREVNEKIRIPRGLEPLIIPEKKTQ